MEDRIEWEIGVGSSHARRLERSADDGKRFAALGVAWSIGYAKKGEEFEEGW